MRFEEIAAEVRKGREFTRENCNHVYRIFEGRLQYATKLHKVVSLWVDLMVMDPDLICADDLLLVPNTVTKYQWLVRDKYSGMLKTTQDYFESEEQVVKWLNPENRAGHTPVGPCKESAKQFNKI